MVVILIFTIFFYVFLNSFFIEKVLINNADYYKINNKYKNALIIYTPLYYYYKVNHFSDKNLNNYWQIIYKITLCYYAQNDIKKADNVLFHANTEIQNQYGMYSKYTAEFIRKYLLEYLLLTNRTELAQQEFNNLLTIYKKIGYSNNIMYDLTRLSGDIYYQGGKYDEAIAMYEKAYNTIPFQKNVDYEIFAKTVNRICEYEIKKGNTYQALEIYSDSIEILKNISNKKQELTADMLIKFASLNAQNETSIDLAITAYKDAINIINTLPATNYLRQNLTVYKTELQKLQILSNKNNQTQETNKPAITTANNQFPETNKPSATSANNQFTGINKPAPVPVRNKFP